MFAPMRLRWRSLVHLVFQTVVVLKGTETRIAHPTLPLMHYRDRKVGLGTSSSGDILAGIVTGLAARAAIQCRRVVRVGSRQRCQQTHSRSGQSGISGE